MLLHCYFIASLWLVRFNKNICIQFHKSNFKVCVLMNVYDVCILLCFSAVTARLDCDSLVHCKILVWHICLIFTHNRGTKLKNSTNKEFIKYAPPPPPSLNNYASCESGSRKEWPLCFQNGRWYPVYCSQFLLWIGRITLIL